MKRGALQWLALALCVAMVGCATRPLAPEQSISARVPLSLWRDGDILVSGSDGWRGWVVRQADSLHTPFTHAGLILIQNGEPMLVHSTPGNGAKLRSMKLADYLALPELRYVAVYRTRNPRYAPGAAAEARRYLAAAVPFDGNYDASSDATLYCTEMIWRSYLNVGLDLLGTPRRKLRDAPFYGPIIWPSDFTTMPDLKQVYSTEEESFWH